MTHPAAKILRNIQTERFHRVFDDWLEVMLLAHCADRSNPDCPHEAAYMEIVRRYGRRQEGKEHPADHFKAAMWTVMDMMKKENELGEIRDHLGEIYEEEGHNNSHMGQYFTPMHLCHVMAAFAVAGEHQEHKTIYDPACGSGRMFLASLPHYKLDQVTFYGTDKDRTCANMAAMNMLWRNTNSFIICGNSLSGEAWEGWATQFTVGGGKIYRVQKENAQALLANFVERAGFVLANPPFGTERSGHIHQQLVEKHQAKTRENKRGQYEMEL